MPTYRFTNKKDVTIERYYPIGTAPDAITEQGMVFVKQLDFGSAVIVKRGSVVGGKPCSTWPRESPACGVAPEQVPQQMAEDRKMGVGNTTYSADGNPIFSGRKHEESYFNAYGYHHRGGAMGAQEAMKQRKKKRGQK